MFQVVVPSGRGPPASVGLSSCIAVSQDGSRTIGVSGVDCSLAGKMVCGGYRLLVF